MRMDSDIDRLFAIYQALYPTKWVPDKGEATNQTELWPFLFNTTRCWTSDDAKDWTLLGFAVPGNGLLDPDGKATLEKYLRENYYW